MVPMQSVPIDPEPQSTEPIAPPDAMRAWVDGLDDQPAEGFSPEDWQRLKQRVKDVASQAEKPMAHGWPRHGLFGCRGGLVA